MKKFFLEFCDPFFVSSEKESKISNKDLIHFGNILNQIISRFKMQELNIRVSVLTKMPCQQFFLKKTNNPHGVKNCDPFFEFMKKNI